MFKRTSSRFSDKVVQHPGDGGLLLVERATELFFFFCARCTKRTALPHLKLSPASRKKGVEMTSIIDNLRVFMSISKRADAAGARRRERKKNHSFAPLTSSPYARVSI